MISVLFLATALLISAFCCISTFSLLQYEGSENLLEANQIAAFKNCNIFVDGLAVDPTLLNAITKPLILGLAFNWRFILNALPIFDGSLHHKIYSIDIIAFLADDLVHVHRYRLNIELKHLQLMLRYAAEEDMVPKHLELSLRFLSNLLLHDHVVVKSIKVS